jgi:hypothetical protein
MSLFPVLIFETEIIEGKLAPTQVRHCEEVLDRPAMAGDQGFAALAGTRLVVLDFLLAG